jgi:ABC-2 type transport system ATP-binding protein
LDEPTIGLDVVAKEAARELIRFMNRRFGCTILLTTHDVKDITETCKKVVLLDRGGLLFEGSLKAFEKRFASERRLVVELERPLPKSAAARLAREVARQGGSMLSSQPQRLSIGYSRRDTLVRLTRLLMSRLDVADLNLERVEVEEIVRRIYSRRG